MSRRRHFRNTLLGALVADTLSPFDPQSIHLNCCYFSHSYGTAPCPKGNVFKQPQCRANPETLSCESNAGHPHGVSSVLTLGVLLQLKGGQAPPAIVLSCSDSRVPPEMVMDQGMGDLFVIRYECQLVCLYAIFFLRTAARKC